MYRAFLQDVTWNTFIFWQKCPTNSSVFFDPVNVPIWQIVSAPCKLSTLASFISFFPWRLWSCLAFSEQFMLSFTCDCCTARNSVSVGLWAMSQQHICPRGPRPCGPDTARVGRHHPVQEQGGRNAHDSCLGREKTGPVDDNLSTGMQTHFPMNWGSITTQQHGQSSPTSSDTGSEGSGHLPVGQEEPGLASVDCHLCVISAHTYQRLLVRNWTVFLTHHLQLYEGRVRCPLMNTTDKV